MEKKKSANVWLAILGVLILAELIVTITTMSGRNIVRPLCKIVSLAFIAMYGFWLYKKPHGNLLKYAMLLLAASEIINAARYTYRGTGNIYLCIIWLFGAAIIVYVAGRLNRIEQNKYLLGFASIAHVIGTLMFVIPVASKVSPLRLFTWFSGAISIFTLMIAYFVRYDEHKEAGIMDAPKK